MLIKILTLKEIVHWIKIVFLIFLIAKIIREGEPFFTEEKSDW